MRHCFSSLPLIALAMAMPAMAQEATEVERGGEIVVTAARTVLPANALPLTIDVIDKATLDQQVAIAGSVVDAVATLTPSYSPTRQKLSGTGETLRGRSPLYAINGIPQTTPLRDGSRDGFTIDPFFVDRVELIFGSNALQGIGGTGGIVNQVTVGAPSAEGLTGRVMLQGIADSDFSDDGLGGKAAGLVSYKAGRFDATVGAAYETRGAFYDAEARRIGPDLTQGDIQDSKSWSVFGRFGYDLGGEARADLIVSQFVLEGDGDYLVVPGSRALGRPSSSVRGDPPGIPARGRTQSVALSVTDSELWGGNLMAQIFWNRTRDTFGGEPRDINGRYISTFQDPTIAPIGDLFDQSENRSRKYGGRFSYERAVPGLEALTATIGFDALWDATEQRLIATDRVWVPPTDFRSLAPFGQLNLKLFDGVVRLGGGARWENVAIKIDDYHTLASTTTTGNNPPIASFGGVAVAGGKPTFEDKLFNGGAIVEPIEGVRAYVSYAEGYTVPDVGRITRAVNKPGVDIDHYLDISPIVSNNKEIGLEVKRGPADFSAAYFWSLSKEGALLVDLNGDGSFEVQRQRIELQGIELNLNVRPPIRGLSVGAGYAHLHGRTDGTPNDNVDAVNIDLDGANISPDRLNLSANYVRGPLSARLQSQFYLARRFDNSTGPGSGTLLQQINAFEGYNVTDASIRYQTGLGDASLSVSNLLNEQYITYYADTLGGAISDPTNNARYFAGRGRVFTLGWNYRF